MSIAIQVSEETFEAMTDAGTLRQRTPYKVTGDNFIDDHGNKVAALYAGTADGIGIVWFDTLEEADNSF